MHKNIKYDLIIFDCDGTLADSEIAHNTVLMEQLHNLGLTEYTMEKCMETYMGRAVTDIVESIEKNYSVRFPDHHWKTNEARYRELLPDNIRLDATCRPLLEKLHMDGQKMAVGSNGTRDNVLQTIKAAGFDEFFPENFVFTFEMVENPKPAPDLYLHVCEAMHVNPRNAVVIEDTVTGAMAGIAAGIDTIGYVGLSHRKGQEQRLKDIGCISVIESMNELSEILSNKVAA
jgi:HAD superfamily hydrolase (TIGR01509 family)